MIRLFILCFLLISYCGFTQITLSNQAQASIITCGSGNELYSVFGHTAIRIYDPTSKTDLVFNFGTFDFNTPNFYLKFVKGDLMYQLSVTSFDDFMYEYIYTNRDVFQQKLNISNQKTKELFQLLQQEYFSDNKKYIYKFIDKNCTSKATDKVNEILGSNIIHKTDDTKISYRQVLNPYFKNNYWAKLGINAIFGTKVDAPATQLFLPIELLNSLEITQKDNQKVAFSQETLFKAQPQKTEVPWWNNAWILYLLIFILWYFRNPTTIAITLSLFGVLGLFFTFVGLFSLHQEILWNYNILLFNPLYFLLLYFWKVNHHKTKFLLFVIFRLLIIYSLYLIYISNFMLFLPLIALVTLFLLNIKKSIQIS
jgi:Domain of unknown function (DUF4105)